MKFSSSGHLEAEHPLYDLIFGPKQSPKLGFANNKMAKNGLNRKNTVYQPYTDRIPTIYRPYTGRIPTVYQRVNRKHKRIPKKISPYTKPYTKRQRGPYTNRIPIVYPVYCQLMPRNVQSTLFGLKLLMKIVIHKFFCLERKRLASAKYRTAAWVFWVLLIMYDLERSIRCFNNHTSHGAEHPLIFADKFQGYQKQFLVTLLHCT